MALSVPQWARKQGAWIFGARTSAYSPGYMFKKKRVALGPARFEYLTSVWVELGLPKDNFTPVKVAADMVQGSIKDSFDADTKLGLQMFGIEIGAGAKLAKQVSLEVNDITGKTLDDEAWSPMKLARLLNGLDKPKISRLFVAHTLYYASSCNVTISTDGSHEANVQLTQYLVEAGHEVNKQSEKELSFVNTSDVPFAFSGMRSKRVE